MSKTQATQTLAPKVAHAAGVVSWIHIGDLHMTRAGEQNDLDLEAIVNEINTAFADAVSFVYLPGDVADDGSCAAYAVVRQSLDRLLAPWCAILGDHDVHEKSFANFLDSMARETRYVFTVGDTRFLAMNAFDIPDPKSFAVLPQQLQWLEGQVENASARGEGKVLLLHCYPSDLKAGGEELRDLVRKYDVQLIDMGHTHYNEIANDGRTLYTATRSTGQIEEGPVGFSVTNIDGGVVSWRFFELWDLPAVMITLPSDERLMTDSSLVHRPAREGLRVRAKVWDIVEIQRVRATLAEQTVELRRVAGSQVWEAIIPANHMPDGVYSLHVHAQDTDGRTAEDAIRVLAGVAAISRTERYKRDQDNALAAWPEHGLLGTQLGPNKNGRKW
jgi:predicted phosphodiesterase